MNRPDILIVEGLNVLQPAPPTSLAVNDYFDFSIYVDAKVEHIRNWYVDRFHKLRRTAFEDPKSYFKYLAELSDEEATEFAVNVWRDINERNLVENIAPTRGRAAWCCTRARPLGPAGTARAAPEPRERAAGHDPGVRVPLSSLISRGPSWSESLSRLLHGAT